MHAVYRGKEKVSLSDGAENTNSENPTFHYIICRICFIESYCLRQLLSQNTAGNDGISTKLTIKPLNSCVLFYINLFSKIVFRKTN